MVGHRVYLDCDGVFADFISGSFRAFGIPYCGNRAWGEEINNYYFWRKYGFSDEYMNSLCTTDFWANLPWMEDGQDILNEIWKRFKPTETTILTGPMKHNDSYTGKAQWVEKHIPELHRRLVPTHVPKEEFAFDWNCLLIDDNQENHDRFVLAGGACILVPRPWNKNGDIYMSGDTVKYIAERLDKWITITKHPAKNRKEQHVYSHDGTGD